MNEGERWVKMLPTAAFGLTEELRRWRALRDQVIRTEDAERMDRASEELVRSHLIEQVVRVGSPAPAFTLPNAVGAAVSLPTLLRAGPVVLSFYRGIWCPFCNLEQRALQLALPRITELGATVVAISGMTPDHSMSMIERLKLDYEVLTDAGLAVAREYGLVFELPDYLVETYEHEGHPVPAFNGTAENTLPIPATFIVDQAGIVRYAYANANYMFRADPAEIVSLLEELRRTALGAAP